MRSNWTNSRKSAYAQRRKKGLNSFKQTSNRIGQKNPSSCCGKRLHQLKNN